MDDEIDWDLIDRYFADEASPQEIATLMQLRSTNPAYATLLASLHRTLAASTPELEPGKMTEAWARLSDAVCRETAAERPLKLHRGGEADTSPAHLAARIAPVPLGVRDGRWAWVRRTVRLTGGLAVAAVLVAAWRVWMARSAPPAAPVMREVATTRGQRANVDLGDGIRVTLAADSRLRYAAAAERERIGEVFLEGEAYFDVLHDARRPFRVRTGTTTIDDIGTRFDVRAYPGDSIVHVAVASGVVALTAEHAPARDRLLVRERSVGMVTLGGAHHVLVDADIDEYLGWAEGRLVFESRPLREVLRQVARWYDAEIQLGDTTLASHPVTATFAGEPVAEVVEILAQALGVRTDRIGRRFVIGPVR